ncbi:hypothetical protein ACRAWD_15915 [Caulobacter segnis]
MRRVIMTSSTGRRDGRWRDRSTTRLRGPTPPRPALATTPGRDAGGARRLGDRLDARARPGADHHPARRDSRPGSGRTHRMVRAVARFARRGEASIAPHRLQLRAYPRRRGSAHPSADGRYARRPSGDRGRGVPVDARHRPDAARAMARARPRSRCARSPIGWMRAMALVNVDARLAIRSLGKSSGFDSAQAEIALGRPLTPAAQAISPTPWTACSHAAFHDRASS